MNISCGAPYIKRRATNLETRESNGEKKMSKLLIASVLGALLAGSGIAAAQIVDDPPGSVFQSQGIREMQGLRRVPSPYVRAAQEAEFRAARAAAFARQPQAQAYAYVPAPAVRHHKVARHHHR